MNKTIVASCSLNQWGMDFKGNTRRIIESIIQAKRLHNAKVRLGSQSEVPGFSIEDHYLEPDTIHHSWEVLSKILEVTRTAPYNDILCVIGMPVHFRGIIFSSAVVVYNGTIILIRPKTILCNDNLSREKRWFTGWNNINELMEYYLPEAVSNLYGQRTTKFGNALIQTEDNYLLAVETLDEAKSPSPIGTQAFLMGAHIVMNVGGSPYQLCNWDRLDCIKNSTNKTGGVYMYSNSIGFDGNRIYFDGQAMVIWNGKLLASTDPFSLKEVDMAVASVDLIEIDTHRSSIPSRNLQATILISKSFELLKVSGFYLGIESVSSLSVPIHPIETPREVQIGYVPACYLWDYLRRSTGSGFFIPLSGGVDSACVLLVVSIMCKHVLSVLPTLEGHNKKTMEDDLIRILGEIPQRYDEMIQKIVYTAYLSSNNNTQESKNRAEAVAKEIGSSHVEGCIDDVYNSYIETFMEFTNSPKPKFFIEGGTEQEDAGLQSLQSRIRMVISYISGQLLNFSKDRKGFLIVLGSTSLEENLVGYHAKYGTSSGDINPIGCISKVDLRKLLSSYTKEYPSISNILNAEIKTELSPSGKNPEETIGLNFEEIKTMAEFRKIEKCGPLSMFYRCYETWGGSPEETAIKVKRFFILYANNRHKLTVMTPLLHMDASGIDDNRYDLRQFLYNSSWSSQFDAIDEAVNDCKTEL
jgi:NAD+ synthase (glutamine-hydrolysing)